MQKAIIAKCNSRDFKNQLNILFLKTLSPGKLLARRLLNQWINTEETPPMNSALLLLNAIAIAVLAAFHFQPADDAGPGGSSFAHYRQRLAPQLAVMNTQIEPGSVTRVTQGKASQQPAAAPTERWVF
ncbi:hypothetical protein ACRZ5O_25390 [Pseudomonas protegens]|uniref:hypothetical protein n=1 Tax=Pseudomonas protegens TaxID=380021 RepID=UPI003FD8A769